MRVDKRDGYRLVVGGPVPPQADAITIGKTIFVRKKAAGHQGLLAHELVHVRQFAELGPVRFLMRYVGSYLRLRLNAHGHMAAYRRIPLEVEASWQSRLRSVAELEPNAVALRDRLAPARSKPTVSAPKPPSTTGRAWNRSSAVRSTTAAR